MNIKLSSVIAVVVLAITSLSPIASSASAQTAHIIAPYYQQRSAELLKILRGAKKEEAFFATSFLNAIPVGQFRAGMTQLRKQYGKPLAIKRIIPAGDFDGTVEIRYEKATVAMRMVVDRGAPHPVIGLQVTGVNFSQDAVDKIAAEIKALPGVTGFQIADISTNETISIHGHNANRQFAIGSVFKLYVLAQLSQQIREGRRNWHDVITVERKSLPSGVLQNWPLGTPMTLQALATMMISISDNTATDTLISVVGRQEIEQMMRRTGHSNLAKATPLLTTLEAFALKMPGNDRLRNQYENASEQNQVALLYNQQARLGINSVSTTHFATAPRHIETIEWFASPADINRLLNYIRQSKDPVVNSILAINTLIPPGDAKRWFMMGGKGGSEPGVASFSFIGWGRRGPSYAVSGSWNNRSAPVDEKKFLGLVNRLLNAVAER